MTKQREMIGEELNYTFDFEYVNICEKLISRLDEDELIDDNKIYVQISDFLDKENCWPIAKHFFNEPWELDWCEAFEGFLTDILNICKAYSKVITNEK